MRLDNHDLSQETKHGIVKVAVRKLREEGADLCLIERLEALSLTDLDAFCRVLPLEVGIGDDAFGAALDRLNESRKSGAVLREFARRGAPTRMLHSLFHVSKLQAEEIKRSERAASKFVGRPRMPDTDEREAIVAEWEAIKRRETDPRRRYLELARRFLGHTLGTLQQVVEKGEKDARSREEFVENALLD